MTDLVDTDALISFGEEIVARARRGGADIAEAVVREGSELSVRVRLGQVEMIREASSRTAALRVMRDGHVAVTSTSDLTDGGLARFASDALGLLEASERDPFAGPADPDLVVQGPFEDLDVFDLAVAQLEPAVVSEMALRAERAAVGHDPRVSNIQEASCSRVYGASAMVLSSGFRSARRRSAVSVGAVALADDADHKKRRGAWSEVRRHLEDLPSPEEVGRRAAERTVDMLGARKVPTCVASVVFPPEVARSLLALLAGSILGSSIWRKTSYLVGREGSKVASPLVHIVDDPMLPRGLGSRAHDGEGLASRRNVVVDGGILRTFLCDSYAARKLQRASTASASRGAGGGVGPSTSNIILEPRAGTTEADIIDSTAKGFLVRQMLGHGFNPSTGDFSRGASGFWIEGGRIVHPVSEVTISSDLDSMCKGIDAVADRLVLRSSALSPMVRVASMTIAGE